MADFKHVGGGYLRKVMSADYRAATVARAVAYLSKHADEFDAFACQGTSGIVFGSILSNVMNKGLLIVRKGLDTDNHSGSVAEGDVSRENENVRYCFVDDLISIGTTLTRVNGTIIENKYGKIVGIYLYNDGAIVNATLERAGLDYTSLFTSGSVINKGGSLLKEAQ